MSTARVIGDILFVIFLFIPFFLDLFEIRRNFKNGIDVEKKKIVYVLLHFISGAFATVYLFFM